MTEQEQPQPVMAEDAMGMLDSINQRFEQQRRAVLLLCLAVGALAGVLILTQLQLHRLAGEE